MEHRSFVAMDLRATILEELNHPVLKNPSNLALNPDTIWSMNQPIRREDGSVDLTEVVSGSVYREAYQKMEVDTETELCVPFSGYLDEIGITANLRNPTQPFLIKCLLPKMQKQWFCLLAYVPCELKSSAEKKHETGSKDSKSINLRNLHSAFQALFHRFDEVAESMQKESFNITLGNTVKKVRLVPVLLFLQGDHKSQQANTCWYGNACCIQCQSANVWDADQPTISAPVTISSTIVNTWNSQLQTAKERKIQVETHIENPGIPGEIRRLHRQERVGLAATIKALQDKFQENSILPCNNAFHNFNSMTTPVYKAFPPITYMFSCLEY